MLVKNETRRTSVQLRNEQGESAVTRAVKRVRTKQAYESTYIPTGASKLPLCFSATRKRLLRTVVQL